MSYTVKRTDDLIEITFLGVPKTSNIVELRERIEELSKDCVCDILVDISKTTTDAPMPKGLGAFFKGLPYRRYAIFGGAQPSVLRTKNLLDSLPEYPDLKLFRTEDDARAWLGEETS